MPNASLLSLPQDYWTEFALSRSDVDYVSNYLFEKENPLTEQEIVPLLVAERIRIEREALLSKNQGSSSIYIPQGQYQPGDQLAFPALGWQKGRVTSVRLGVNPSMGEFDVIEVEFESGGSRSFAARLADHALNNPQDAILEDESLDPEQVIASHGAILEAGVSRGLRADDNLVQTAGRWFPRALLMDIGVGHLNLAEAVLDEASGSPLSTPALLEQVALPGHEKQKLVEFSMNFALQEDGRFDEVGPAGEVLWCLKRLEPSDVQQIPLPLRYMDIPYDRSILSRDMLGLEASIDDELGAGEIPSPEGNELTICLTYPHWRSGTLPISSRTRKLFPTAYESERVRFTLVDARTKEEIPAWVVRQHGYVAGLKNFFQKNGLIPGTLVTLRRSQKPGQVIIEAHTHRPQREWVRTVLVGSDGGIVFATLKQNMSAEFNERMVIAVPDIAGVDGACDQVTKQRVPFEKLVDHMMQELTKLNVQGHVHAQELYSAINILRRCPPGPLMAYLSRSPLYKHVGDLHFRIADSEADHE